jgi:hypothetical protein
MTRITLLVFSATLCCHAQVSSQVTLSNGVQLSIATSSDNGTPIALKTSLEPASGSSFYRIFRDDNDLAVFAYELEVTRTSDGQKFRVTAKPATADFAARFPNADGGKPTPTRSAVLESPLLASGERFDIDVPSNPGFDQKLSDNVRIVLGQRGGPSAPGSAQIRFSALRVSINGQLASPPDSGSDVAGRYAMFYIPGRGGYFFSAEASEPPPFLKVGVVDGKHLTFVVDNETYDCTARVQILVQSERGELWVYQDPNYKPGGNWTKTDLSNSREEFFTAASDSVHWWIQ